MYSIDSSISLETDLHLLASNTNFVVVSQLVEIIVSDHRGGSLARNCLGALAASL